MKKFLFFIFIFLILINIYSQDADADLQDITDEIEDIFSEDSSDDIIYYIYSVEINIDGRTRDFAVLRNTEIEIGSEITGKSGLDNYVSEKKQLLTNQRVLDNSNIEYTIGEPLENGMHPVNLIITAKDTWNFIILPQPKYDDNTGFELFLKMRDYNFLGTITPLRIDIGFEYDEHNRTFFNLMADSNTPFTALNLLWFFKFYNFVEYRPDMSENLHYYNTTGLSIEFPIGATTLTLGFNESFILNEENTEEDMVKYGLSDVHKGLYLSSYPYISWQIPSWFSVYKWGQLFYTAKLSASFNHGFPEWPLDDTRIGPFFTFNHKFNFGRIDWHGNFKNGLAFNLDNNFDYDYHKNKMGEQALSPGISASLNLHKAFYNHFGLSARFMYRQWFMETVDDNSADVLRGILDKKIKADVMFSLNSSLTVGAIKFHPSEWFNASWLKIFDMDIHLSPFIDAAVFRSPELENLYSEYHFTYKNMLVCSGLEVIVFPLSWRSLFLRGSLGVNLSTLSGLGNMEIYIGTELFY